MRRILLTTDFSKGARAALDRAVRLAVQSGAPLDLLHAAPDDGGNDSALQSRLLGEAHRAAAAIGAGGIQVRAVVTIGDAEQAILNQAEKSGADLVVLGGHGEPRFRDAVFGTTATHVVRHSPVPVLIVQTDPALPYAKVLVAADEPDSARSLMERALAIAPAGEIFAVHAFHPAIRDALGGSEALAQVGRRAEAAIEAALEKIADAFPNTRIHARRHILAEPGEVISVLMDETERLVPDLVVMGTRHRATYFGSRAVDACFWCPTDLLVVPEPTPVLAEA